MYHPDESTDVKQSSPSFISNLPDDILLQIFRLCLPTTHDYIRRKPFPLGKWAPFTLGRVCGAWRKFVLSEPSFWTVIYIGARLRTARDIAWVKQALQIWQDRSNARPVTLSLQLERDPNQPHVAPHSKDWQPLLSLLARILPHCACLEIGGLPVNLLFLVESFNAVRELTLLSAADEPRSHPFNTIQNVNPKHWFLRLRAFESHHRSNFNFLCLRQTIQQSLLASRMNLRVLKLCSFTTMDVARFILEGFPSLEELGLNILTDSPRVAVASNPENTESRIRTLSLSLSRAMPGEEGLELFFREVSSLTLPMLRSLKLSIRMAQRYIGCGCDNILEAFAAVLVRSKSPTETLRLGFPYRARADVEPFLQKLPFLRILHISFAAMCHINDIAVALTPAEIPLEQREQRNTKQAISIDAAEWLCPKLETVIVGNTEWARVNDAIASLSKLIKRRSVGGICTTPGQTLIKEICLLIDDAGERDVVRKAYTRLLESCEGSAFWGKGFKLTLMERDCSEDR